MFEEKYDGITTTDEWIHTDHLGSVAVTTDSLGDWTTVQDSYPFGDQRVYETSGTELDNRYSFTNKERDEESDLMYFEARYLATDSGRFMSKDPVAQAFSSAILLKDPQMQNAYSYSRNNPINYVDPDGEFAMLVIPATYYGYIAAAAIVAAAVAVIAQYAVTTVDIPPIDINIFTPSVYEQTVLIPEAQIGGCGINMTCSESQSLPLKGTPGTSGLLWGNDGELAQERLYDQNGNPVRDIDHSNHGNEDIANPHKDYWSSDSAGNFDRTSDHQSLDGSEADEVPE